VNIIFLPWFHACEQDTFVKTTHICRYACSLNLSYHDPTRPRRQGKQKRKIFFNLKVEFYSQKLSELVRLKILMRTLGLAFKYNL
jgi:hypothetical protein